MAPGIEMPPHVVARDRLSHCPHAGVFAFVRELLGDMKACRRSAPDVLPWLFGLSSLVHIFRPQVFERLIPRWLTHPRRVIYVSGFAEMICAIGLIRRTRWSRRASVLLLAAIFPGNLQMALDAAREGERRLTRAKLLAFGRLPLQALLAWAAWQAKPRPARQATPPRTREAAAAT